MANGFGVGLGGMQQPALWEDLLRQLQQSGIAIDPNQTYGFANRNVAGTNTPSQHAYGRAVDINAASNPEGFRYNLQPDRRPFDPMNITPDAEGDRPGQTAIPSELARAIAQNNQMRWGGDFQGRSPDPMHFELAGSVPATARSATAVAGLRPPGGAGGTPTAPATDTREPTPTPTPAFNQNYGANPLVQAGMQGPRGGLYDYFAGTGGDRGGFGGFLDAASRGVTNPTTGVGLSLLFPQSNAGAIAAQAGMRGGMERRAEEELGMKRQTFQQEQNRYSTMLKIWGQAFPGGQADPNHPLLKGVPPELAQTILGMGPEAGLPILGKLQTDEIQKRRALELQRESGKQMAEQILGPGMGGPQPGTFQPPPQGPGMAPQLGAPAVPQTAPQMAEAPGAAPTGVPGTMMEQPGAPGMNVPVPQFGPMGPPPQLPPLPPQMQPQGYTYQGGQRSGPSGEAVLQDPQLRRIMYGHIMAGKPDEAMKAYQSALEKAQAPRLAGETKYAQDTAETQAADVRSAQSMREAWGLLDDLERNAKALGNSRLNAAASPTLDTWTGRNLLRHAQQEAYADRNQLMPYLEQLTVLARAQLKGQGWLTDQENEMLQKTLTSARNATSAEDFFQNIGTARSILSRKIPERTGYVPPHILRMEQEQAATEARREAAATPGGEKPAAAQKDLVPPKNAATRTDDLAGMEGANVYDHKTGRWGTVVNGEFVPTRKRRGTTSDAIRQMYAQ